MKTTSGNRKQMGRERINGQSKQLFNGAILQYNRGLKDRARQMAQDALRKSSHTWHPLLASIHGLLSFIFEEKGELQLARRHCMEALNSLDIHQANYRHDKKYFQVMLEYIDQKVL